jgi:3-phenylpropionate/trans-cinnamate dioxygenase ferredoxin reductase subunit
LTRYQYLIVGGGLAADSAVHGIREIDKSGSIGLITREAHAPYNRPPLSKALWKGAALDTIWRKTADFSVTMHLSHTAKSISLKNRTVVDDHRDEYGFDKLLLATGGKVRQLSTPVDGIIYFRTLDDYDKLRTLVTQAERFVVIGGGFIGSELAAALTLNKKLVTMIFPDKGIGARVYPSRLSSFINSFYREKGVTLLNKEGVALVRKTDRGYVVTTTSGREISADAVVAGLGITPDVELAQAAGLNVENGILVDELLQTSQAGIYAAGDVANFFSPSLGKRVRVEHEDNALTMGETAGKNMAGGRLPYTHLPFFYSDLFELGYEAVGELDARYEMVEDWKEEFKEGIVYYLSDKRVRGVLLWNTWSQVDHARALIDDPGPFTRENVRGRLPA